MSQHTTGAQRRSGGTGGRPGGHGATTEGAKWLALPEVARELDVHYMTAYRYVRTGSLRAVQHGGRWQVAPRDLDAFRRRRTGGQRGPGRVRWEERRRRLLAALLAGDERTAWSQMEAGIAVAGPTECYLRLLAPALREVGEAWASAQIGIAEEHCASAVAGRLVGRCGPYFRRPGRTRGTVLLACVPGERHALPVAIAADVIRAAGWSVTDLGADAPHAALLSAARAVQRLTAVGLSASVPAHAAVAADTVEALHHTLPEVPVIVGGGAIADNRAATRLGADAWAADARGLAEVLAHLPAPTPARRRAP